MQIDLTVSAPLETGVVGGQNRRCIPITGGSVSGTFKGIVENGGADWQTILPDGSLDIDARYILRLAEGTVEVELRGLRTGPPEVLARLGAGEKSIRHFIISALRCGSELQHLRSHG